MSDAPDDFDAGPSKSLRKRQSHELQKLGEQLIDLPQDTLDELKLPESLHEAIVLARRITKRGGLARQKQLIGKLMRKIDAEPIRIALAARNERDRAQTRQFHMIERWRSRLIDDPETLDEFVSNYPNADRVAAERLIIEAQRERGSGTPKAARELFGVVEKAIKNRDA
jgi:ribosome-associated protein